MCCGGMHRAWHQIVPWQHPMLMPMLPLPMLPRCSRCGQKAYCSPECQRKDWKARSVRITSLVLKYLWSSLGPKVTRRCFGAVDASMLQDFYSNPGLGYFKRALINSMDPPNVVSSEFQLHVLSKKITSPHIKSQTGLGGCPNQGGWPRASLGFDDA